MCEANAKPGEGGGAFAQAGPSSSDSFCSLRSQAGCHLSRRSPGHHALTVPFPAILPSILLFLSHLNTTWKLPESSLPPTPPPSQCFSCDRLFAWAGV